MEPKTIEIPGIPGKLREQTLDEYLSALTPDHLARKQLDEIRNQALRSVELSTQLMQANDKILELQGKLMKGYSGEQGKLTIDPLVPELHAPTNVYKPDPDLVSSPTVASRAKCPNCGQDVSTLAGPWAIHQQKYHPDNQAPRPV